MCPQRAHLGADGPVAAFDVLYLFTKDRRRRHEDFFFVVFKKYFVYFRQMLMDFFPYGLAGKQSVDESLEMFVEAKTLSRGTFSNLFWM